MTTMQTFAVRRRDPELVTPAAPTPRETKRLSDHDTLRYQVPNAFYYRGRRRRRDDDEDPAGVIRRALGEALVPYYPLAGRLREVEARKLVVDCTGEGVLFVEADADVRLAELEEAAGGLAVPADELLFDVEGSSGILNCPLLLIQVTRLLCGGFVFALRINHVICDASGIGQFISAVAELARGLPSPTVAPAWSRKLLEARSPPRPSFAHREYDAAPLPPPAPPGRMVSRSFTFTRADIAAIKAALPTDLRDRTTAFEALAAAVWRAHAAAHDFPADDEVRLVFVANFRHVRELGLPAGYYGNACVLMMAVTTAGALRAGELAGAVELVREAKAALTAEYVRSTADFLVLHGQPCVALAANLLYLSDTRHAGFHHVDFGWGEPVYGGAAHMPPGVSVINAVRNGDGEDELVVPLVMPRPAMDRFTSEIEMLLKGGSGSNQALNTSV
ncbi:unnamed protein product [Urochloa decumbens]|uniref:Uncharacterized protein n=1 Tax=Urochloa decumbens TaxID=240449 RepID=A0ABC9E0M6_9POAL